ncbi:virulence-associated E family protein [Candidatus Halocynthiibacter alkanivorans]|uniref:virulence-associated E family protein n=1 Tax=Candidatus Halocynthiibacter alkanivorans TaxID=2267619 RepID=UPI000DF2C26F|nr:virulence-associated E family protein [Candidatus Halocynthiibacter alkanivorans]
MAKKQRSNTDLTQIKFAQGYGLEHMGMVKNREIPWSGFQEMMQEPTVDKNLTVAQYMALDPDAQAKAKCGKFVVGGPCKGGRRKRENVTKRYLINLDVDNATRKQFDYFMSELSGLFTYTFVAHTTRSHTAGKPKFRVYLPLKGPVDEVRFVAISRIMASMLFATVAESMDAVDEVSFRIAQLMYLPSISKGQDFWSLANEGEILDAKKFLAEEVDYDWQDYTLLPYSETRTKKRLSERGTRAEDPTTKRGMVGAFCRTYDIEAAIADFLPDVYEPSVSPGSDVRYNYIQGTGSNGAIVYDDGLFIYSQHGSDPIGEQLCNSFDMVRLHLYGDLDKGKPENTSPTNLPSYIAMVEELQKYDEVTAELAASNVSCRAFEVVDDDEEDDLSEREFEVVDDDGEPVAKKKKKPKKKAIPEWVNRLTRDTNGNIKKTKANISRIMCNDIRICHSIATNELTGTPHLLRPLDFPNCDLHFEPIPNGHDGRPVSDTDFANLAVCFSESREFDGYGMEVTDLQLHTGALLAAQKNSFNPVKRHMEREDWDGVERLDTFFIDFFKAEDTPYHRECGHIFFMGAALRTYEPGCVFRLVIVLEGEEDIGKSGALQVLAFEKYHVTLSSDFKHKQEMVEQQRNSFIVELGELSGMSRSSVLDVKNHLSLTSDTVRLSYRKNEENFPRRCIFAGTTNLSEYLKDSSGNTRFLPIKCGIPKGGVVDFKRLIEVRYQLWAEALHRYREMRKTQPEGALMVKLKSDEAIAEATDLREDARLIQPFEQVAEILPEYLDKEGVFDDAGDVEDVDVRDDRIRYKRAYVSVTSVQEDLADNPIIRGLGRNAPNIISAALKTLTDWAPEGNVTRGGKKARWWVRKGVTTTDLWVPADEVDPDWDLLH